MRLRRQSQRYYIVKDLQKPHPEKATMADMPELLDFLYGTFTANNPTHPRFEWLYPDMFLDEEKAGRHLVLRSGGRIVSSVGTYPMNLNIAGCEVSIAGVGQVATAPEMMGRGCMSRLLEASITRMEEEGAALSWLAGRHDRYGRFGWEYVFRGYNYSFIEKIGRSADDSLEVTQEKGADAAMTGELFAMRGSNSHISDTISSYSVLMRRSDAELWVARRRGSAGPVAWAIVFPGAKRLAEYCGAADGVMRLVKIAAVRFSGAGLFVSSADKELNERMRAESSGMTFGGQMLLVVSIGKVLEQYAPYINSRLPAGFGATFRMRLPGGRCEEASIGGGGAVVELDRKLMARLLFGPERATQIPGVGSDLAPLDTVLPLPCSVPDLYHV